jgi:oxygen-independent coproporphyrinogen-3 oxidase
VSATGEYIEQIGRGGTASTDTRPMSRAERMSEALFMGLRLARGVDLSAISEAHAIAVSELWERYGEDLTPFIEAGLLRREGSRLWLARQGMLLANEVMAVFV